MIQYDAIRLVAILAIVLLHTAANGVNFLPLHSANWWLANFVDSACRTGVPLFLMLTGALLLNRQGENNRDFYRRRWQRLAMPVAVWTVIYIVWSQLKACWKQQPTDLPAQLMNVLAGHPYFHLWFVYMLIALYAVLPMLRHAWQRLDIKQQLQLTFCCLLLQQSLLLSRFFHDLFPQMPDWLINADQLPWPLWFVAYLPYVMLGALLAKPALQFNMPVLLILALLLGCVAATAWGHAWQRGTIGPEPFYYTYQRLSLPVILSAVLLWQLISHWQRPALPLFAKFIVAHSFGIYLMHPVWLDVSSALLQQPWLLQLPYALKLLMQWTIIVAGSLGCCVVWHRITRLIQACGNN